MAIGAERIARPKRRRRVGPPGWAVVARKELADHLLSVRFAVLLILLGLVAAGTVYAAASGIREAAPAAGDEPALFLRLFTLSRDTNGDGTGDLPSFLTLVGFLAPLLGIAFGFDAVNGERAQGTLPRLVSQPIHRDDVINGKFAAGLTVIGTTLFALTLIVAGIGFVRIGIVPRGEDVARIFLWVIVTVIYVGFWLALATLCSVALRRAATSALVAIAAWLVFVLFAGLLVGLLADAIAPVDDASPPEQRLRNVQLEVRLGRLSPATLYDEATIALLNPEIRTLGLVSVQQLDRAVRGELSLDQSLIVAWPQIVVIVALTVLCFAAAYILFMRQEIRA